MKDDGNDKKRYSSSDIRKYLKGELSSYEMYEMERAAMDDPFLADALEGMEFNQQQSENVSFGEDMEELEQRLESRITGKKRTVSFAWWRVAASIVLLTGAATLTYIYLNKSGESRKMLAVTEKVPEKNVDSIIRDTNVHDASPKMADVSVNLSETKEKNGAKDLAYNKARQESSAPGKLSSKKRSPAALRKTSPADNLPLPAISEVADSGQERVTASVRIAPAKALQSKVAEPAMNKDHNSEKNTVQLKEADIAMQEVVVLGYDTQKKVFLTGSVPQQDMQIENPDAAPVSGWEAWYDYVEQNKKNISSDSSVNGVEVISFVVNKKGKLSNFKVVKSLSESHTAEAIRLVRKGPSWEVLKGNRQTVTVSISF